MNEPQMRAAIRRLREHEGDDAVERTIGALRSAIARRAS